jgi:hypothetical protein
MDFSLQISSALETPKKENLFLRFHQGDFFSDAGIQPRNALTATNQMALFRLSQVYLFHDEFIKSLY